MIRLRPQAASGGNCPELNGDFVIQIRLDEQEREDAWELCREIERLGGVETGCGFAFSTSSHREMALEILRERCGSKYF